MFTPKLYIGIGEHNHFFTLRESYLHYMNRGGYTENEVRYQHLFNLSQNAEEALAKARDYALQVGMTLVSDAETLESEMRDIKRATEEQLAAREAYRLQQEAEAAERKKAYEAEKISKANNGIMPFGKYKDLTFSELSEYFEGCQYLIWIANSDIEDPVFDALRSKIKEVYPDAFLPKADRKKTYGKVGERIELNVTVVKSASFVGEWGTVYILSMVSDDGTMFVSKGKFYSHVGSNFRIKATIKAHSEYNGQMQTVIQRVKAVEAK